MAPSSKLFKPLLLGALGSLNSEASAYTVTRKLTISINSPSEYPYLTQCKSANESEHSSNPDQGTFIVYDWPQ